MKKVNLFVVAAALGMFASCGTYEAKTVTLNNVNDSLNYALGLANGDGIKQYYLQNDSTGAGMVALLDALTDAYNAADEKEGESSELFNLGKQIGSSLKMQETQGLIGNKDLQFNIDLVMQGLINGLNEFEEDIKGADARTYFQTAIEELRAEAAAAAAVTEEKPAEEKTECAEGCEH